MLRVSVRTQGDTQVVLPEEALLPTWLSPFLGEVERAAIRLMRRDSEAQRFLVKYLGILSHPLTTPELRYVVAATSVS